MPQGDRNPSAKETSRALVSVDESRYLRNEHNIAIKGTPGIKKPSAQPHRQTAHSKESDADTNDTSTTIKYELTCTLYYKSKPRGEAMSSPRKVSKPGPYESGNILLGHERYVRLPTQKPHIILSVTDSSQTSAYSHFQSVKVGPGCLPVHGGRIRGKFYDLTAQRSMGPHTRQYRSVLGGRRTVGVNGWTYHVYNFPR